MGRKKNVAIGADEYSFPQDDAADTAPQPATEKDKPKKGGKAAVPDDDDYEPPLPPRGDEEEEEEPMNVIFTGKKKKGGGAVSSFSAFDALAADEDQDEEEAAAKSEGNNDLGDAEDDDIDFDFSKAKKKKKKKDKGARPALEEEDEAAAPPDVAEKEEEAAVAAVTAAKKPQKKKKKKGGFTVDDEDIDKLLAEIEDPQPTEEAEPEEVKGEDSVAAHAGGKKSKKKKKNGGFTVDDEDIDKLLAEIEDRPPSAEDPEPEPVKDDGTVAAAASVDDAEGKKSKKKKKKSGRSAQEEEDLDKLLAELGEGPLPEKEEKEKPSQAPPSAPVVKEDMETTEDGNVEQKVGEGEVESAAAKKKKKKKEKEKEKKAAAKEAEAKKEEEKEAEVPKGKVDMKKLPKHVREMQEALARRQEAEERRKCEEEERLKKEEEERLRREEEERKVEEAKKRKKEREKEKLLKKKQEGKLLTGKQKEEAKRLEAMRRQFLEQSELQVADGAAPETKKRPIYDSKKKKAQSKSTETANVVEEQQQEVNEANNDEEEYVLVDQESQSQVEESEEKTEPDQEVEESKQEEEEEDEDEWDAKSWDDIDVNLPKTSAFEEEETKAVVKKAAEPVQKQESSKAQPTEPAVKKVVPPVANSKKSEMEDGDVSNGTVKRNRGVASKKGPSTKEDNTKNGSDLRSPICCILGHVDTGKTKLLDCIRRTNVQEGEAGGITQQIGATYFPTENIRERTKELKADATLKVPGLLVIDTPGHESFSNLRSRGSSLCDIAILVVDIMHGLEPQTIESLNLLKSRDAVFIVALNKVDRLYGWKRCPDAPIVKALKQQNEDVKREFNTRLTDIVTQLKMQGVNTALYYKNKEMEDTFNIVPTSAISGEGIPDLLLLLVQWAQKTMEDRLTFVDEVQCTVLEVKVIEGHGTTVDVVLVNGIIHEGDQIVVCGMQGPIVTTVRALLTPHPMRELRVKGTYQHHKKIRAAQGIKISAQGLEHAIAGTALYVVRSEDGLDKLKDAVMEEMTRVRNRIDKSGEGVYVQASTLGSLEALTEFLKSPAVNIPFCDFSIGPVHKKDVMKASVMLERKKEYATILAFDVKVMPDARDLAEESGVRIFVADIIYHLFDQFTAYIKNLKEEKKKESADEAVFPCVLKIMPNCVFNKKDPIVLGVDVLEGIVKLGTPLCIPTKEYIGIGKIASIEINHKQVDVATKGQKVAIKIIGSNPDEQQKSFGRHFDMEDELVSHISRRSIDLLKENYRDDLSTDDWKLVVKLKTILKIP